MTKILSGTAYIAPTGDNDFATKKYVDDNAGGGGGSGGPIGSVLPWTSASIPSGYLLCDGSLISRTTYADLFAVIGTTFGVGDGSTTFGIPDLRGRFPIGKATSGTASTLGGTGGAIDHTHSVPAHFHAHDTGVGSSINIASSGGGTTGSVVDGGITNIIGDNKFLQYNPAGTYGTNTPASATQRVTENDTNARIAAHTHSIPNHIHATGSFAGSIGNVNSGISGNAAMTSGVSNPPFQVFNFIIKYTNNVFDASAGITYTATDYRILANTLDGSDNALLALSGGGAANTNRGAQVRIHGNEHVNTGQLTLSCGNVSGANVQLYTEGSQSILLTTNNTTRCVVNSSGDLVHINTNGIIRADTSDGVDNKRIYISGGGDLGSTRGAEIIVDGNEATDTGRLLLSCGNVGGATIQLRTFGTQDIFFYTNNTARWAIGGGTGHLLCQTDNTYNIGSSTVNLSAVYTRQVGCGDTNPLILFSNNVSRWLVSYDSAGSVFAAPANQNAAIYVNTSDGTDNSGITLSGAPRNVSTALADPTRGAGVTCFGNESGAGFNGSAVIQAGGSAGSYIWFRTGPSATSRWAIYDNGHLIPVANNTYDIGAPSLIAKVIYTQVLDSGSSNHLVLRSQAGGAQVQLGTQGTNRFLVREGGDFEPAANATYNVGGSSSRVLTFYSVNALNTSDQRLKTDVVPLPLQNALDKVCALNPVNYKLSADYCSAESDRLRAGFLAQEAQVHIPEAVVAGDADLEKEYGDEGFETWSMQSDHLIPYLVAAIKKLKEELDEAKARLDLLENP